MPTPVPSVIEVPEGNVAFIEGHAVGTQNYICLPSGWTFIGPQATLFDDDDGQIITHFLSPSPAEGDTARDTWQPSLDTSRVWAMESASTPDPDFVEPGAIDRLLLQVVGRDRGPTGGRWLTETAYMPRVYTAGGLAPTTGCAHTRDIGQKALVPHIAD